MIMHGITSVINGMEWRCTIQLSVAVTHTQDNNFIKRKALFWLSVFEVPVCGRLVPLRLDLWWAVYDGGVHMMEQSHSPRGREQKWEMEVAGALLSIPRPKNFCYAPSLVVPSWGLSLYHLGFGRHSYLNYSRKSLGAVTGVTSQSCLQAGLCSETTACLNLQGSVTALCNKLFCREGSWILRGWK